MKADLSRNSFDPQKHYSRVILQQGRVQLDADWNEQVASLVASTRQVARDLSSFMSWPPPFSLSKLAVAGANDLEIGAGTIYVDGIACRTASQVLVRGVPPSQLVMTRWTVDGEAFAAGQMLRVSDDSGMPPSALLTISAVDFARQRVTCTPDPGVADDPAVVVSATRVVTYLTQPDLPHPPALPVAPAAPVQVYLDVWERHMTPIEDDAMREVALGGASTADRARVVWQVKWLAVPQAFPAQTCLTSAAIARIVRGGDPGTMRARVRPAPTSTDPCTAAPGAPYRGAENQLYRVEVNTGSFDAQGRPQAPTFKWSRENGAVVFPIANLVIGTDATTLTLGTLGPDDRFGLEPGDRVEVCDDEATLWQRPGQLLAVQSIDRTRRLVVLAGVLAGDVNGRIVGLDPALHPLLRRWDHGSPDNVSPPDLAADGCLAIVPASVADGDGGWQALEDGVEVLFETFDPDAAYLPGDYWFVPARVAIADLLWPKETGVGPTGQAVTWPAARLPDGIEHHYAALAVYDPASTSPPTSCLAGRYYAMARAVAAEAPAAAKAAPAAHKARAEKP